MLNINVLYIYPKIYEVNKEINLIRIIDEKIKETIIIYAKKDNESYEINITNTLHGQVKTVLKVNNINELDDFIKDIKELESNIVEIKDLSEIEKYILKLF